MIGNIEDAETATRAYAADDYSHVLSHHGTSRMVYLINDVVYKVDFGDYVHSANACEYDNIMTHRAELPSGVYFPEASLFYVKGEPVIAMEYIEGQPVAECFCMNGEAHTPTCMPEYVYNLVVPFIDDTSGENVIITPEGRIYIIDAAW